MLHHAVPWRLWVVMEVFAQKKAQWVEFLEKAGSAELVLLNLCDSGSLCDDLLRHLPGSSVRLSQFSGPVGLSGAAALAAMARRSQLDIRLRVTAMPTETTEGNWRLDLYPASSDHASHTRQLPGGSHTRPPRLDIIAGEPCNPRDLADAIISLTPQDKRFSSLSLEFHLCNEKLSDEELRDLLQRLQDEDIRTSDLEEARGASLTHAVKFGRYLFLLLVIGDQMSPRELAVQSAAPDALKAMIERRHFLSRRDNF
ncbi:uncharacterized protein LOC108670733 [Hyalella azteca]|uniref:Uncharacterized protein LOC108670733 n=1 Tax=Hyalella azteca TaxID=294128 RepID=A0A8B7NJ87_HYAAZ|nr:uncharacterized protein LOC108670733 [Hyalella azteca]